MRTASRSRKARSVAEVVAAEAGGKTAKDRFSAMKDVFSAIANRAKATGQTLESVISGRRQFDAYSKKMPAGTANLVALAEKAIADVEQNGPTHKGTYYARSYATKNLPKGLTKVKTAVDDHVYYTDPKNRAIVTATGAKRPTQQVAQAYAEPTAPQSALASFFSDPFGMSAQAAEAPQGLLGATGYDSAKNPANARAEAMFANAKATPQMAQPSRFARDVSQPVETKQPAASRFGPPAAPSPERFGTAPRSLVSGPVSPEHYASATAPASTKARAAFDAVAQGIGTPDLSSPASRLGASVGSMVGPAKAPQGRMSPDGMTADPFGTMVSKAQTARAPAGILGAPTNVAEHPVATAQQAYTGPTASLSPNMMAPGMRTDDALALSPQNFNALQPPAQTPPSIESPSALAYGPDEESIDAPSVGFPDAPSIAPPSKLDGLLSPNTKRALTGLMLAGPVGGLLGLASGPIGNALASIGGPAGMASAGERYGAGFGIPGMTQGMFGPRGATGYSRSNPGTFAVSRGPNQGYDLTNAMGKRTTYGPAGDIRANADTDWGGVLGGLFGGESKKSDKGKSGKGNKGGINGSGYSGKGLY